MIGHPMPSPNSVAARSTSASSRESAYTSMTVVSSVSVIFAFVSRSWRAKSARFTAVRRAPSALASSARAVLVISVVDLCKEEEVRPAEIRRTSGEPLPVATGESSPVASSARATVRARMRYLLTVPLSTPMRSTPMYSASTSRARESRMVRSGNPVPAVISACGPYHQWRLPPMLSRYA